MSPTPSEVVKTLDFIFPTKEHQRFIEKSFSRGLVGAGWSNVRACQSILANALRSNIGTMIVAVLRKEPELFYGWAYAADGKLVWVYVVKAFRRLGIGVHLISTVLPDIAPIPCKFWSHDAAALAGHGIPIFFDA